MKKKAVSRDSPDHFFDSGTAGLGYRTRRFALVSLHPT
jgi:hypothetical protein